MSDQGSKTGRSTGTPRTFDDAQLAALLQEHRRWVESGGTEGTRAMLRGCDLSRRDLANARFEGADLSRSRLRGVNLQDADLEDADLSGADFQLAELTGADLKRTNVRDANFRDANLADADLSGARGLLAGQLGGANLAGARLPDEVAKFEGLSNVAEASKTTQNLFFSILFVCAYIWLTIASTRDAQLLNNAAPPSSRLPILGTDIPLVQFYIVAPLLLLCLFIYFHLCLQRLWEELGDLPAIFPDGRSLDKKAYPWLLNVLVRTHAPRLKGTRTYLTWCQAWISIFLAWGLVPLTLIILWGRYLRAHDWWVTGAQIGLLALAIGAALGFRKLAEASLRGSERKPFRWKRAWRDARLRAYVVTGASAVLLVLLSYGAIQGHNPTNRGVEAPQPSLLGMIDPRFWIPRLFQSGGYSTFAQLDEASLSTKPENWSGGKDAHELEIVRGADLEGRNLRYAQAWSLFGVNAFMHHADLSNADLRESDLRRADLREANLQRANLREARLQNADLRGADVTGARFKLAKLAGANLKEVNGSRACFEEADLTGANMTGANLQAADLTGAKLDGTNLAGADLRGVIGLTREQLAQARCDERTRVPRSIDSVDQISGRPEAKRLTR